MTNVLMVIVGVNLDCVAGMGLVCAALLGFGFVAYLGDNKNRDKTKRNRNQKICDPCMRTSRNECSSSNGDGSNNENATHNTSQIVIDNGCKYNTKKNPRDRRCQDFQLPDGDIERGCIRINESIKITFQGFENVGKFGITRLGNLWLKTCQMFKCGRGFVNPAKPVMPSVILVNDHGSDSQRKYTDNENQSPPCESGDELFKESDNGV